MTLEEGYGFALKALVKTMETTTPSAKKIELVSINFNMEEQIQGINISEERIKELLKANGLTVAEDIKNQWSLYCLPTNCIIPIFNIYLNWYLIVINKWTNKSIIKDLNKNDENNKFFDFTIW